MHDSATIVIASDWLLKSIHSTSPELLVILRTQSHNPGYSWPSLSYSELVNSERIEGYSRSQPTFANTLRPS